MSKKRTDDAPKPPSREGYSSTYLPKALYTEVEKFAKEQERSAAFLVRKAVEAYLVFLRTGKYPETEKNE